MKKYNSTKDKMKLRKSLTKVDTHKKALIKALEKSLGIVTSACIQVDISRQTFYNYLKDDKEFALKVKDIENIALDFVESVLFQNIKDRKEPSTIFYLKTKGKGRGYIERQEITGKDGEPIKIQGEWIPPSSQVKNKD